MKLAGYRVKYVALEDYVDVERFIRIQKRTIYINTAARAGANIVRLIT